ncbi:hypothetical protein DL96DRAFT_1551956 [Flagelloscypha sp. PMI_526]|nr:hypothetical protein DL96DRAFT_1551956 [Flagelloscypha sp. PMI_526]
MLAFLPLRRTSKLFVLRSYATNSTSYFARKPLPRKLGPAALTKLVKSPGHVGNVLSLPTRRRRLARTIFQLLEDPEHYNLAPRLDGSVDLLELLRRPELLQLTMDDNRWQRFSLLYRQQTWGVALASNRFKPPKHTFLKRLLDPKKDLFAIFQAEETEWNRQIHNFGIPRAKNGYIHLTRTIPPFLLKAPNDPQQHSAKRVLILVNVHSAIKDGGMIFYVTQDGDLITKGAPNSGLISARFFSKVILDKCTATAFEVHPITASVHSGPNGSSEAQEKLGAASLPSLSEAAIDKHGFSLQTETSFLPQPPLVTTQQLGELLRKADSTTTPIPLSSLDAKKLRRRQHMQSKKSKSKYQDHELVFL